LSKYDETAKKADLLAAARKSANVYVTKAAPGADDSPERILLDAGEKTAKEMLDNYAEKMSQFDTLPLDVEGKMIRLFRGEWTIFSGYAGTGKTSFLREGVCRLLKAGKNIFVATLEQDPEEYLIELAATAAGVEMPTEKQLQCFLDTYGSQLKLWGMIGVADHRKILATVRSLKDAGLDYAILDSLMMLDIADDDIDAQRKFAALLTATVQAKKVHIILVAHPKKPMAADQEPSIHDVAGSSKFSNLAYNVIFIRRGPQAPGMPVTPMQLHLLKRRTRVPGGFMGMIEGYYYSEQTQFHIDSHQQLPTFYLPASHYAAEGLNEDIPAAMSMPAHIMNPNAFRVRDEGTGETKPSWEL
jgi:KaiC/GvpD/RAD55 family RecA-like ATPase